MIKRLTKDVWVLGEVWWLVVSGSVWNHSGGDLAESPHVVQASGFRSHGCGGPAVVDGGGKYKVGISAEFCWRFGCPQLATTWDMVVRHQIRFNWFMHVKLSCFGSHFQSIIDYILDMLWDYWVSEVINISLYHSFLHNL